MGNNLRKILVILIILIPAVSYTGCKKQAKCGCSGDTLFSYTDNPFDYTSIIYNASGTSAYFTINNGIGYDTYYFCNPGEMYPTYTSLKGNSQIIISGNIYWDCSYVQSAGNSSTSSESYYSYYKVYQLNVTKMAANHDVYGKK